jgi:Domain of unknown function (DUF4389)
MEATSMASAAAHPVRLSVSDDLRRNRLTVFFRYLLVIPHGIWLAVWGIAAYVAAILNWFATLFTGRSPQGLHDFLAAYLRYMTHVNAYMHLLADPYPGFTGAPGYPVDLEIAPPEPQSRLVTLFRLILAIPAFIVAYVLGLAMFLVGFFGWFVCLALGRMPEGMRNLGSYCLRYTQQTAAYAYFTLTDRYPSF